MNALPQFGAADAALLLLITLSTVFGLFRGLFREVFSLAIWLAAVLAAWLLAPALQPVIAARVGGPGLALPIAHVVLFVAVLVIGALLARLGSALIGGTGLTGMDRLLGMLFGALRGGVIAVVVLVALQPFAADAHWWQDSQVIGFLLGFEGDVVHGIGIVVDRVAGWWPAAAG